MRALMTRHLRAQLAPIVGGLLIGSGLTSLLSDAGTSHADDYDDLVTVNYGHPSPTFDQMLKAHRAVIGCMDGLFVVGGLTFAGMDEVVAARVPYFVDMSDGGATSNAFVRTWHCNRYNRFTQD